MVNRLSQGVARAGVIVSVCAVAGGCVAAAGAATVVPTSLTSCYGTLAHDKKGAAQLEPNLLSYSFSCDGPITAYSIIANQDGDRNAAIDDFAPAPSVFEPDDLTPSPTETIACEGVLPSDGINCNTGALGLQLSVGYYVAGTIDPVAPYCKHLPTTSATGKPAKVGAPAIPTARVQFVVTDATGAEDGPFIMNYAKACPKVPSTVPPYISLARRRAARS